MDIGNVLGNMISLHPEFSLKIGRQNGIFIAEVRINGGTPATVTGGDPKLVIVQAHANALKNIVDKVLAESRLSDTAFDSAIEKEERGCCGGCCGCSNKYADDNCEEDDDYEDEDEDYEDDNLY